MTTNFTQIMTESSEKARYHHIFVADIFERLSTPSQFTTSVSPAYHALSIANLNNY